jgi:hypothetical protein
MNVDYKISPVATSKDQIVQPKLAEAGVIPKLNTSTIIIGQSGSGKTVLLHNLMTRPEFYKGVFDKIFLISPTCESDDVQRSLDVPESCRFTDLSQGVEALKLIEASQEARIKKVGSGVAPKYCIICDDCAGDNSFMTSKEFISLFIRSRHYNTTVFFLSQHFKRIPKICRLQASYLVFFAVSNTEAQVLAEEFAPPGVPTKQFMKLIDDTLKERFDFLSINMRSPWEERFRKGLSMAIDLDLYRKSI